jgi:hypothetical protein
MRYPLIAAILTALTLGPVPLYADPPRSALPGATLGPALSAAEFDAYSTGKTLFYAQEGAIWGAEHYMPNHQVMWAFAGNACEYGQWYEDQGAICFVYEGNPDPNCWYFYRGARGLIAEFLGGTGHLSEVGQSNEPLDCAGPQVGV